MEGIFGRAALGSEVSEVQAELARDEKLLWAGKPAGGIRFPSGDILMIPFSLMWGGFAIFWELAVLTANAPLLFKLWGIPFVLVGIYLIGGRFLVDAMQRSRTFYGVTDKRAIIVTGWPTRNVQSIMLRTLTEINLKMKAQGRGTITFGSSPFWMPFASGTAWPGARRNQPPGFVIIPQLMI